MSYVVYSLRNSFHSHPKHLDMFGPKHRISFQFSKATSLFQSLFYSLSVFVCLTGSHFPCIKHINSMKLLSGKAISVQKGEERHTHTCSQMLCVSRACWKWASSGQTSLSNTDSYSAVEWVSLDSHLNLKYHTACYFRRLLSSLASLSNVTSIIHSGFRYNCRCMTNVTIHVNIKQLQYVLFDKLFSCLLSFKICCFFTFSHFAK